MRRARMLLASAILLTLSPTLVTVSPVHAGGHIGTAMTDFTQVTPDSAVLYAAIQSTSADQPTNLLTLEKDFEAQPGIKALVKQTVGSATGSSGVMSQVVTQVLGNFRRLFSGEFGMALLPVTFSTGQDGKPLPHLHLLFDAGLQPGVTGDQLGGALTVLGLGGTSHGSYRNLPIVSYDLNSLASAVGGTASSTLPANGPITGVFFAAVAGNDAVVASDLPTLKRAIDTWFGTRPSIAATPEFQTTVSALPAGRVLTSYIHLDTEMLRPIIRAASGSSGLEGFPARPGMASEAFSVSIEPDGVLMNASPAVLVGSLMRSTGYSVNPNEAASLAPGDAIAYSSVNDPASLIRMAFQAAFGLTTMTTTSPSGQTSLAKIIHNDAIKQFNKATGLNFDDDILSWMHGELSFAVLPVGSRSFGQNNPLTDLSVVAALKVTDQAFVQAKLDKIFAVLNKLSGGNGPSPLQFVDVPGPSGEPLHILSSTPNGVGYAFFQGYLVVASALPADIAALQRGSSGGNLASTPLYQAALAHLSSGPLGTVFFVDVTHLRVSIEKLAAENGVDLKDYNRQARPLITAFKSLSAVGYAGSGGGGAMFIGIGR